MTMNPAFEKIKDVLVHESRGALVAFSGQAESEDRNEDWDLQLTLEFDEAYDLVSIKMMMRSAMPWPTKATAVTGSMDYEWIVKSRVPPVFFQAVEDIDYAMNTLAGKDDQITITDHWELG